MGAEGMRTENMREAERQTRQRVRKSQERRVRVCQGLRGGGREVVVYIE